MENLTQHGRVGVAQASMPQVDTGGERDWTCGGGGGVVHWVEFSWAITSVENHTGTSVLHRKTSGVKFNSNRILTSKTTNGAKVGNKVRRHKNIRHFNRSGRGRKGGMTNMCNGEGRAVTNGDAGEGVDRGGRSE